jgi:multidrug efflux pump subunit AcrA (membrane-fusion protein)
MAETGTIEAHDPPVAVTGELPLDDENVLAPPPPTFWRRYRWPIVAVAVVVVAAAIALPLWLTSGSSTPTGLSVTTVTVSVTTGTMQSTVSSSGTVAPASSANLNFAVSGTVTAVDVKAGQTVTAGQVIATVDTSALAEQVNAAEEQLTAAQDRLASDEATGASTSTIDSDQSSVTSAQSSLSTAQTNLGDASLTSTISGTVAQMNLTVGQQVTGTGSGNSGSGNGNSGNNGSGSTGSSAQVEVIGTNSYIINATVDDTQIGQISDGDQVDITTSGSSATSSTPVYGTVGSISLIGSQSSNVTTFPVVIDVTGDPPGLYAGATASATIIVKQLNNVTEVPTGAISYNTSGQATVTEVVNGAHVVKDVTTGVISNGETQIVSGVSAGAKLLEQEIRFTAPGGGTGIFGGNGGGPKGFPGGGGSFFRRVGNGGGGGGGGIPSTGGS